MLKFAYRPPSSSTTSASASRPSQDRKYIEMRPTSTSAECQRERRDESSTTTVKMAQRMTCVRRKLNGRRRCRLDDVTHSAADHVVRDVTQTADDVGKFQPMFEIRPHIWC